MHCSVRNYYKGAREHRETDNVFPQSQVIKAKCAENGSTRDFYIETVFAIDKCQISGFVNDQGFKSIMEDRQLDNVSKDQSDFRQKERLTACNHTAALGIASWFNNSPAKSKLKSITKLPIRLATPPSLKMMPMKRQMAAAARLKRTRINMNLKKEAHSGLSPTIG
jgi:hypothetical protein